MSPIESPRPSPLAAVLGIVALACLAFALYSAVRVHRAEAAAIAATHAQQADSAKIEQLTSQVRAAEQKQTTLETDLASERQAAETARAALAAAQKGAPPRPGPAAPDNAAAVRAKQRQDGQEFLARFGGQASEPLLLLGRAQIARNYAALFRSGVLTPAQIEALQDATAQHWLDTLELAPNGIHPGEGNLKDDEVKRVLGEDGFQKFQEFRRSQPFQGALNDITTMSIYAPFTPEQSTRLLDTIASATAGYREGAKINPQSTNWDQVVTQSQAFLSPAQIEAVKAHAAFPQIDVLMKQFYGDKRK